MTGADAKTVAAAIAAVGASGADPETLERVVTAIADAVSSAQPRFKYGVFVHNALPLAAAAKKRAILKSLGVTERPS
jgi:hypothetical protein